MTADAAPVPEATSQKVSRAGTSREMGCCLKPMGTRHDVHLQAGPSLCRGQQIFSSPARQGVGSQVLVGAAGAAGKHSQPCPGLHPHFQDLLQFMNKETDVSVWVFGQI